MMRCRVFLAVVCLALASLVFPTGASRADSLIASDPDVPFLAQSTPGHDPADREAVRQLIRQLGDGPQTLTDLPNSFAANFESPPVKPLAIDPDGVTLYVVNTAADTLSVLDTSGDELIEIEEIHVGLDPVSVAFEPGSSPPRVWVTNLLSDSVNVVDVTAGLVIEVIEVADEPANILFDEDGGTAFVVSQSGILTSIDVATLEVLGTLELECHTPRAAIYDNGALVVAALHSGNNTTTAGQQVTLVFDSGAEAITNTVGVVRALPMTRDLFNASELAPWPTPPTNITDPSPVVELIIPDAGSTEPGTWPELLALIDDGTGAPSQAAIDALVDLAAERGQTLVNAEEALQVVLDDSFDTIDNDLLFVNVIDPAEMVVEQILGDVGTTLTGMALDPVTKRLFVSNLEPRNLVATEPALLGHFVDHEMVIVDAVLPEVTATDLHASIPDFNNVDGPNIAAQEGSLANPVDIVFSNDGLRAYVVSLGADRVGVLDPSDGSVLGRVDVGRGPRGLAIDSDRDRLFVLNRTDLSVSMLDVSSDSPGLLATLDLRNPESADVVDGRDFLYSTKFSHNFASSCALCHIDGRRDHLVWDLGDPGGLLQSGPEILTDPGDFATNHPVKGPMFTQTLQGLLGRNPYHWRGDRATFIDFNPTFEELLGGELIPFTDMQAFERFINTVRFPPNPFRLRDDSFQDERAAAGGLIFAESCNECHNVANNGASRLPGSAGDSGLVERVGGPQTLLVRQLRGVYKKEDSDLYTGFGPRHSGRDRRGDTSSALIPVFELFDGIFDSIEEIEEAIAFVTAFPGDFPPIVGLQVHPEAPVSSEDRDAIQLMIDLHTRPIPQNEIAVHGQIDGVRRTLQFVAPPQGEELFFDNSVSFSHDDLIDLIDAGLADLTYIALPVRQPAFQDDFESFQFWQTNPDGTDTATTGQWVVADPAATFSDGSGAEIQLGTTTSGLAALVTDPAGDDLGCCDVDSGVTSVRSPVVTLPVDVLSSLSFQYNFAHTENATSEDFFRVTLEGDAEDRTILEVLGTPDVERPGEWIAFSTDVSEFAGQEVTLLIEAADNGDGSLIEAAVDDVVFGLRTLPAGNEPPTLVNPGSQVSVVGVPVSLQLEADDPNGDPLEFVTIGLPTGLSIDSGTGLISGTPTEAGPFGVIVTVSDGEDAVEVSFGWGIVVGPVFEDDFESPNGWVTDPDGTDDATTGAWEVADPASTFSDDGDEIQLGTTVSGTQALVTDGSGEDLGCCDVDDGVTSVRSPSILLPAGGSLVLSLSYNFAHLDNATSSDFLRVSMEGDETVVLLDEQGSDFNREGSWISFSVDVSEFAGQAVTLLIEAADESDGSLVEAAIDDVVIEVGEPRGGVALARQDSAG